MVFLQVKKKGIHYYKCQKCEGGSINANTTVKAKAIGANELFKKYLNEYQLPDVLIEPFKASLELTYKTLNSETKQEDVLLK